MTSWQPRSKRDVLRVHPFRGVRFAPRAGRLGDLTFTPPTSWSGIDAGLPGRLDPHHVLHLLAPAFGADARAGSDRVRALLGHWLDTGVLDRDPAPALYVYQQGAGDDAVVGVIGAADLSAGRRPAFVDHEEVIESLVDTQERLERTAAVQVEPILALHRESAALDATLAGIVRTPALSELTDSSGTPHRLWSVTDDAVQRDITDALPDEPSLIADGHHRHAAWRRAAAGRPGRPEASALTLLTSAGQPGLGLGAVHRVVTGLPAVRALESTAVHARPLDGRAAAVGFLSDGPTARCVLYADGRFHAVTPAEPSAACAAPELAVCHLHSRWLPQWGVAESDVGYVHELDEAISLAAGTSRLAVLLPVTGIEDVFAAAEQGRPLPRKATSFGPKPLVGLVLRSWLDTGS